jgi:hypothetical protein
MKTILFFVAALMLTTTAQAKTVSCTIASIKGRIVTIECQGKTISLETGQKIRVKEYKKKTRRILESC